MPENFARGVSKQLILGKQTDFATIAPNNVGKLLRRVNSAPAFTADQIRSNEILPTMQIRDSRLGVRRGVIPFSGQLSPGTYNDFFEGMVRRPFSAGVSTGAQVNITAAAGPPGTFTRAGGSFITDGFKLGDVVRWTGWTTTGAANNARNYRITGLTATAMTVTGLGNEAVAAKAAGDTVTCAVVGKKTFIPAANQEFMAYTLEELHPNLNTVVSHRYIGAREQSLRLGVTPNGMVMLDSQWVAKDRVKGNAAYFASPAALGTSNSLAGTSGTLRLNGVDVAVVTGFTLNMACAIQADPVVGATTVPEIFQGTVLVDGTMTVYLQDTTYIDLFDNETEFSIQLMLTTGPTINADFMSFVLNRAKLMNLNSNDSDRAIIQNLAFFGLEMLGSSVMDQTTIVIQDSLA